MSEARAKAELRGVYQAWKAEEVEACDLLDAVARYLDPTPSGAVVPAAFKPIETCGILPPGHALQGDLKGCTGCTLPHGHTGRSHQDKSDRHGWVLWEDDYECGCCAPDEHDRCISFLHSKPKDQA